MGSNQDCQDEACAIQACLQKTNYNESKCMAQVEALYRCCDAMYVKADSEGKTGGEGVKSTACPLREVVKRKMKTFQN